jgi:tRNA1(Val) A37 N6-methylase TrmN6
MGFTPEQLTQDGFLNTRLRLWQPRTGYRAATDPVFLAACVPAKPGEQVLELGCGVGAALFCLGTRVPGLSLAGVEMQADYAELARRNGAENSLTAEITTADFTDLPPDLKAASFDHVLANPPYGVPGSGTKAANSSKDFANVEETPLEVWIDTALRRLKPKGMFSMIHRSERLPEILAALDRRVGGIGVKPLASRAGSPAGRILLRARKGSRAIFRLHPPLILHEGPQHPRDSDSYTQAARAILRDGSALEFYENRSH